LLAGLAGWLAWLAGLACWLGLAGWLGWLAGLAGWLGWLAGWLGLLAWLAGTHPLSYSLTLYPNPKNKQTYTEEKKLRAGGATLLEDT
jgi:hypothetical protein